MPVTALPALSAALVSGERPAPVAVVTAEPPPLAAAEPALNAKALAEVVAQAKESLQQKGVELAIEFDDELGRAIFRLVDSATGELVRQVPSEEMLALARALAAGESAGVLLKARA